MNDWLKLLSGITSQQTPSPMETVETPELSPLLEKKKRIDQLNAKAAAAPANTLNGLGDTSTDGPMVAGMVDKGYTGERRNDAASKLATAYMSENPKAVEEARSNFQQNMPEQRQQASLLDIMVPTEKQKPDLIKELLDKDSFSAALKRRDDMLNTANLLEGANQLGAAIAGGKNVYSADNLRKQAALQTEDYTKKLDVTNKEQMNDASSDISKFAQERAASLLKQINPNSPLVGKLNSMTAEQLKSAFGNSLFSSIAQQPKIIASDKVNLETGNPVVFINGVPTDSVTKQPITDSGKIIRDIARRNPVTGLYDYYSPTTQVQAGGSKHQLPVAKEGQEAPEYNPQDLNKVNPIFYKDTFKKQQEAFIKDMKDSRDVATGAQTLSAKLKPGSNDEVDSGLLGGIQTQAAKMAGQKGVLTDQDLVKFAGAGGVAANIDRIVNGTFFGNMSENDIKFFKAFAKKMEQVTAQDIQNRSEIFTDTIYNEAKTMLPNLQRDNVKQWLNVNSVAPSLQNKQPEMVSVISPDGKSGKIPKENLDKALKQGYKEVK